MKSLRVYIEDRKMFLETKMDEPKWEGIALSESLSWDEILVLVPGRILDTDFDEDVFRRLMSLTRSLPVISKYQYKDDLQALMCEFRNQGTIGIVNYIFNLYSLK